MEESHYRALLEEVRSDIADAEQVIADANQSIEELSTLETYLLTKVDGAPARQPKPQPARSSSKPAPKREEPEVEEEGAEGKGMQTVEFGPDGFPST